MSDAISDLVERKRAGEILRTITLGTAAVTGREFFRELVIHLTKTLGLSYAFVAECLPHRRARSLAYWKADRLVDNFEYNLAGTPCEQVVEGRVCFHSRNFAELFPNDRGLVRLGIESYHGAPLLDSGRRIIGHLVVMDDEAMQEDPLRLSVLEIFAARAGAELERLLTEEKLKQAMEEIRLASSELAVLLNVNRAIGRHLQRDELFGALADSLRSLLTTDLFGVEMPIEGNKLQGHLLVPSGEKMSLTRVKVLAAAGTACHWVHENREWLVCSSRAEIEHRFPATFEVMREIGMESLCALPLISGDRCRGVLFVMAAQPAAYEKPRRGLLEQIASAAAVALDDCLAHEEVRRLRDRLAAENAYLQEEIRAEHNFDEIVGKSSALCEVLRQVEQIAATDSTVLILGETGTGKELIARAIHDRSRRKSHPLVKVNCGALSAGLVDSELFGHVKGAYTGALTHRDGRFKLADGGTIFLDEVGELPAETQVKLLRVLQEQEFEPIGSSKTVKVNVRIIAATNRDLTTAMREGKFRSDLFYRLNVVPINNPPLRERESDIPLLVSFFLQKFTKQFNKPTKPISGDMMRRLRSYPWPGNIRELQNVIERAVVLSPDGLLRLSQDLSPVSTPSALTSGSRPPLPLPSTESAAERKGSSTSPGGSALQDVERQHIHSVLVQTDWIIEGNEGAAKMLNLNPSTLRSRMQKLGIKRTK